MSYRNPVIPGFVPDPSVCRVGDDYVLVTSSFTYFPGVPVLRSNDLVSWTHIGNALDRVSQIDFRQTKQLYFLGICAPTIGFHDGRFWMTTTSVTDAGPANFFVTATDPAGPWSEPVHLPGVSGIDPDLAWDDDGTWWVNYSSGTVGAGSIMRCRIDDRSGELLEMRDAGFTDGPDRLLLGHDSDDGSFVVLAEIDGRSLSTEVAGGFSGRVVGLSAVGGTAWFDWFDSGELSDREPGA